MQYYEKRLRFGEGETELVCVCLIQTLACILHVSPVKCVEAQICGILYANIFAHIFPSAVDEFSTSITGTKAEGCQ